MERTLVLVKPDGVERNIIGKIIDYFETAGLKVIALKMEKVDEEFLKKHYAAHLEKHFFVHLLRFMMEGPVVAMVLEGEDAVKNVRRITGATDPSKADKGSIRGDLGIDSWEKAEGEKRSIRNLVHASGNLEEAENEVALWFPEL